MCCDQCHREIDPGTERTVWGGVKRCMWVCAVCFTFIVSVFGQTSPTEEPPPILLNVGSELGASGNTMAGTFTHSSSGHTTLETLNSMQVHQELPLWSGPEQQKEHHKFSPKN